MKKFIIALALSTSITGCASLGLDAVGAVADVVKPQANNGTQVDTTAQVGKDASRNTTLGASTKIEGDGANVSHMRQDQTATIGDVAGSVSVQNIANIPAWVILLLVLGWMAPKPTDIVRGIIGIINPLSRRKNKQTQEK